jgi:hypothetical protein
MDITQRGDISQGKATYLSEDEASYLNYRLMIVYHCRVSKESSDSPFSQTKGLREESHFGCVNSICKMNHSGIIKTESITPCRSVLALQPVVWYKSWKQHHSFLISFTKQIRVGPTNLEA